MHKQTGFTLIELMIVVATVAILTSLAMPLYTKYVQRARRADAQQVLLDMANNQALWRSSHTSYGNYANLGSPTITHYSNPVVSGVSATAFTLTATATAGQAEDSEQGTSCTPISYVVSGTTVTRGPAEICWSR